VAGPRLARRYGLRAVLTAGLAQLAAGVALLASMDVDSGYGVFLAALLVAGLGFGVASATATNAVVVSLPRDRRGIASAVNDANREIGSAIGIAIVGSIFSSGYQSNLPSLAGRVPERAADAVKHSAAAGIDVATRLGDQGTPLAPPCATRSWAASQTRCGSSRQSPCCSRSSRSSEHPK
jgi:fucose permease